MEQQKHTRVNNILLGPLERPALEWLSKHMPSWISPDHLTAIGLAASILIFVSYWLTSLNPAYLWLASFGFLLNWFGDSLDGTLARQRKIERPLYGFFVDHAIDSLSMVLIFCGLGLSPYVRFEFALLALVGYMLLSVYTYLVTYVNGVFRISFAGLGPTEVRSLAILTNTVVFFTGNQHVQMNLPIPGPVTVYDLTLLALAIVMLIAFIVVSTVTALDLEKKDTLKLMQRQQKQREKEERKQRNLQKKQQKKLDAQTTSQTRK
jgi:phosphatidylglycerophosphate synthase